MGIKDYFRRFLPVVVDVETGGFNPKTNALLEVAVIFLKHESGLLQTDNSIHFFIEPFPNSVVDKSSADFIGYSATQDYPRISEIEALSSIAVEVNNRVRQESCTRAILVGHNAQFDLSFLNSAFARCQLNTPFHKFSTLDTVTVSALMYGHTVLSQACQIADIGWDNDQAHNALYDSQQTAKLFCLAVNQARLAIPEHKKKLSNFPSET